MHAAAAAPQPDRMLQVKHLVVNDVLDGEAGDSGMVEDPAHHDGIVGGIVVPQTIAGMLAAPRHLRSCEPPVKKPGVELIENGLQVGGVPLRGIDPLPSAYLAH